MVAYRSGAINPPIKETLYSDLGLSFTINPITKKVKVVKNEEAIKRAVKNLILTNNGEKFFKPLYGGNITALLFENFSQSIERQISSRIKRVVNTYEPRVTVLNVNVTALDDSNSLVVKIFFRIKSTNKVVDTSFQVERIR